MAKVTIDNLAETIMKDIEAYSDEQVKGSLDRSAEIAGKDGVRALKSASKSTFGGTGKYAEGWTMTKEVDRLHVSVTLHNSMPGLPHLLEYGHANRGGGRTPGRTHIKPVEEQIIRAFEKEFTDGL